jgi:uncharacterized membrane protein YjgN (DUF898 family)
MTASLALDTPAVAQAPASLSFSGRGRDFLGLLVKGSLLQIPTFGFYRFWLVTKLRRHLWANTALAGESFEYTGTAKELLIGFLIALAVLTPIYILYFVAGLWLEEKQALASLPLILILYVLAHFGAYRARRYRATRTIFRGVRFWMTGSGWAYAGRAIRWDIANILTLGFTLPWASASLERYRMRHTFFGNLKGDFVGTGWELLKRGIWIWILVVPTPIALVVAFVVLAKANLPVAMASKEGNVALTLLPTGLVLFLLTVYPLFLSIFTRWHIEGIRFGEISLSSSLTKGSLFGPFVKLILSSIGFALAFGGAAVLFVLAFQEQLTALQEGNVDAGTMGVVAVIALGYLVLLLGFGVIQRYFMSRGLWAAIAASITVSNLAAMDRAAAAGQPSGSLGEGLADALDFGGGL